MQVGIVMDNPALWSGGGGLVLGTVFGIIMQRSHFCMVTAISNMVLIREFRYIQAILAAWAVAIAGTALLESGGYVAVAESAYRKAHVDWLGVIGGGLLFGFGAALAGGCLTRNLVNAAEGRLSGFLTLLSIATLAALTQYGALAPAREFILKWTSIELSVSDSGVATLLHIHPWLLGIVVASVCVLLMYRLGSVAENRALIGAGAAIGLLAVLGWFLTGWIAQDEFAPTVPNSVRISGPLARVAYAATSGSGFRFSFGTTFVLGVFAGAAASALITGRFHWIRPESARIPHYLVGGAFMGCGATLAGGCNIGQGLSGVSTLSVSSLLAVSAFSMGTYFGIRWWQHRV